jgi:hypothetical protein
MLERMVVQRQLGQQQLVGQEIVLLLVVSPDTRQSADVGTAFASRRG